MTTQPSIPTAPSDMSSEWVAQVFDHCELEASVQSVKVEPIGTGQMASSLRVTPTYTHRDDRVPTSFVVKMASADPNSRAAGARGAYLREVRFYQQLSDQLPVATPASYWSAIDADTHDFAIVLEDMHPAQQGDQIAGSNVESVLEAARNAAGLHAPRWADPSLFDLTWLTTPRDERHTAYEETKAIVEMVMPGFIDRYQGRIDDRQVDLLQWFADTVDSWLHDDGGRFALVHADYRLDNLLFNAADDVRPVTAVDWQTIGVRNPVADISYLLGTSLEPDARREAEHDVVASYHQRLCDLGVPGYSLDECLADYRAQTPHALLLTVLGSMLTVQTDRGDDMFMAMLHRSSQQMFDLDVR